MGKIFTFLQSCRLVEVIAMLSDAKIKALADQRFEADNVYRRLVDAELQQKWTDNKHHLFYNRGGCLERFRVLIP